jgi:DNA-binding NarL/FixJ family response regulator
MDAVAPLTRRPTLVMAEDHPQIAGELRRLLAHDYDVVGLATDGLALLTLGSRLRPDVVVTDIAMPGMDGLAAASQLVRLLPGLAVIFVSVHGEREIVRRALSIGHAFVVKAAAGDDLVDAVRTVLGGGSFVSQGICPG